MLADRPEEAQERRCLGHFEMDTIVPGTGHRGGRLILIDLCSRLCIIEPLKRIAPDDMHGAMAGMRTRRTPDRAPRHHRQRRRVPRPRRLERFFRADVYDTRAYAS